MKMEIVSAIEKMVMIVKAQPMADIYFTHHVIDNKIGKGKRPLNYDGICEILNEKVSTVEEHFELFLMTPSRLEALKEFGRLSSIEKLKYKEAIDSFVKVDENVAFNKYSGWITVREKEENDKYVDLGLDSDLTIKVKIVMEDHIEYPYKADKIKGLFAAGVEEHQIFKITQLSKDFVCSISYVRTTIKTELDKRQERLQKTANNSK